MADPPDRVDLAFAAFPAARRPSWDDLAALLAVAVHGSMNRAAEVLGESQPTVGRRLKRLETATRLTLVQRSPNKVVLTSAGRALADAMTGLPDLERGVTRSILAFQRPTDAPLRLTCITSVALFLTSRFADLRKAVTPADVTMLPSRRILDLVRGEADIALRMRKPGTDAGLLARRLGMVAFTMYATSRDPCLPVIMPSTVESSSRQRALANRFLATRPAGPVIDEMHLRMEAVAAGVGIGSLPCWYGDSAPGLVRVSDDEADLIRDEIFLVRAASSRGNTHLDRLATAIATIFRRERACLEGERQSDQRATNT